MVEHPAIRKQGAIETHREGVGMGVRCEWLHFMQIHLASEGAGGYSLWPAAQSTVIIFRSFFGHTQYYTAA